MANVGKIVAYDGKSEGLGRIGAAQPEMMWAVNVSKNEVPPVRQLAVGKNERPCQRIERCCVMKTVGCGFQNGGEG